MKKKITHSVINGDIEDSRLLEPSEREYLYLKLNKFLKSSSLKKLGVRAEMYRGDAFQCLIEKPENTLHVMLLIRCFVKTHYKDEEIAPSSRHLKKNISHYRNKMNDVRQGLGFGTLDIIGNKISNSDGPVFVNGSIALIQAEKNKTHFFACTSNPEIDLWLNSSLLLLDTNLSRFSAKQYEVLAYKLQGWTEHEIAQKIKISQPAVNQRIHASIWSAIEHLLLAWKNIIPQFNLNATY